jgi:glutathione-specific gamma-glutamylcyclotransferase
MTNTALFVRDPAPMLERTLKEWQGGVPEAGLWVFGYASLIWRPDFDFSQKRPARVHGWHRALQMWSRVNRGTPECPGLVFAMLSGGSCQGMAFHVPQELVQDTLKQLWVREMPTGVYDPRWLRCTTAQGEVRALAFTLSRRSPNFCGVLTDAQYAQIFSQSCGRYGSTWDYAQQTYDGLLREGIRDLVLEKLLFKIKLP